MLRTLSIRVRNYAFAEHTHQELMRSLGTSASVFYAYALYKRKNYKFEKGFQHKLIMRVRN